MKAMTYTLHAIRRAGGVTIVAAMATAMALSLGVRGDVRAAPADGKGADASFPCDTGPKGWKRATAVSPDLVPPCNTGSAGVCSVGYEYVKGTGWCRPRR